MSPAATHAVLSRRVLTQELGAVMIHALHTLCPLRAVLQEVVYLKEQHEKAMAAAARMYEEAVQVQQRDAREQLAEQGRAVASARSALQAANTASSQASQVRYSSLAAPCTFLCFPSARLIVMLLTFARRCL